MEAAGHVPGLSADLTCGRPQAPCTPPSAARTPRHLATPRQRPGRQPQQHDYHLQNRGYQQDRSQHGQHTSPQPCDEKAALNNRTPQLPSQLPVARSRNSPQRPPTVVAVRAQATTPAPSAAVAFTQRGQPSAEAPVQLSSPTPSSSSRGPSPQQAKAPASDKKKGQSVSIGHYMLGRIIGEGTFGKVRLGTHILTGEKVAVKVLEKRLIVDVADVERVAREVRILKLFRHRYVVQLFEIIETSRQLFLIMEYAAGGELFDYIVECGRLAEPEACSLFRQIMDGVEAIHDGLVVHRDLKPENILLDEHKRIKIVDFGLSNTYREGQLLKTACGSPCYAAPEMIAGHKYVPSLCDVWSCGVLLFAMICGRLPFEDANTSQLYKKILAAEYTLPNHVSGAARVIIAGMLTTDPDKRFSSLDVRRQPWFNLVEDNQFAGHSWLTQDLHVLEEDCLEELRLFDFPVDYARRCLQLNKHNHVTTTYRLLVQKKRRMMAQVINMQQGHDPSGDRDDQTTGSYNQHVIAAEANVVPSVAQSAFTGDAHGHDGLDGRVGGSCRPTPELMDADVFRPPPRVPHAAATPATPRLRVNDAAPYDLSQAITFENQNHTRTVRATGQHPPEHLSTANPRSRSPTPVLSGRPGAADSPRAQAGMINRAGCKTPVGAAATPHKIAAAGQQARPPHSAREARQGPHVSASLGGSDSPTSGMSPPVIHRSIRSQATQRPPPVQRRPSPSRTNPAGSGSAAASAKTPQATPPHSAREAVPPHSAREARDYRSNHDVLRTSTKPPHLIMQELKRAFAAQRIATKQVHALSVKCQSLNLRFDLEVAALDRYGSVHAVRARRIAGESWQYKAVCSRLLAEIRIA